MSASAAPVPWHAQPMCAFDVESSGTSPEDDRIVTACVTHLHGSSEPRSRSWLVNPGVEIPEGATAVHGVTTERAIAEGCDPAEAVGEITTALAEAMEVGVPVVAFNARFDLTMLDREARRHGVTPLVEVLGGPEYLLVVDPYVLDKAVDRFRRGKRTLSDVCAHYQARLTDAHDADADAIAAARVAWRIAQGWPAIGGLELSELHRRQVEWAAEQAASLEDYFRRQGRNETVEQAWPVVPFAGGG